MGAADRGQTTRAPRENQILAEPATPQRCAEDYAAAEAHRRNQSNRDDANLRGGK
ncbi:hypothetical protein OG911_28085 [Streptomyces sp. NBC_00208]|uniref:hypothetical protein n=1 Tax=Streptomyces sp. NBC_00208 TaxID=2975681 RepID=UPI002E29387D|nr:hypothetical protein [Streptomyces sp. NBC_00208]